MRIILLASAVLLSACESSTAIHSASQKGIAALSCVEINNIFAAVERDKYSADAARQLGLATNIPYIEGANVASYYEAAKTAANVALLAQGCGPLPQ